MLAMEMFKMYWNVSSPIFSENFDWGDIKYKAIQDLQFQTEVLFLVETIISYFGP